MPSQHRDSAVRKHTLHACAPALMVRTSGPSCTGPLCSLAIELWRVCISAAVGHAAGRSIRGCSPPRPKLLP